MRKAGIEGDVDFLREGVEVLAQAVIELEAAERIGAERHERTPKRVTYRNGHRLRDWITRVGRLHLKIPKLRDGSFFPELGEPRRRSERALVAVVQEAYVHGVSTRKMDELVKALGLEGISKSEVSRLRQSLDEAVDRFLSRRIELPVPYVWLDATYLKVREDGRVIGMALVVAIGVRADGEREVLGLDLGPSEEAAFWQGFPRGLVERGLRGVKLVVSDAPKAPQPMVAALVRMIFIQADQAAARASPRKAVSTLERRYPRAAALLADAEDDVLAHMAVPERHRRRLHSTNPL